MIPVDAEAMLEIAPRFSGALADAQARICREAGEVLQSTLEAYAIDTRLRIAHFLAQTCHESAGFRTTEEFASGEAYEGRADLGNTRSGDGVRYKGRGLIQLTGRANYRSVGRALGIDLERNPALAAEPRLSLRIACEYWRSRNVNALCDRDDLIAVTRSINGGLNGLDDRRSLTTKAKAVLARIEALMLSGAAAKQGRPVLRRGSKGEDVAVLQSMLRRLGYRLTIDADFGAATELAVMRVQAARKLTVDGIVGPATWRVLEPKTRKRRGRG
jgi:putative chitinase